MTRYYTYEHLYTTARGLAGGATAADWTDTTGGVYQAFSTARPRKREPEKRKKEEPMKKKMYNLRDRVKVFENPPDHTNLRGRLGIIIQLNSPMVTVEFDEEIDGGHDGGGNGRSYRCWNIDYRYLEIFQTGPKIIKGDFEISGKNVRGYEVEVLSAFTDGKNYLSVVQFKENIGGHSGDGLGKKGHCWTVPSEIVIAKEKKK